MAEQEKKHLVEERLMERVLKVVAAFFSRVKKGWKGESASYQCSMCGELGHNRATCTGRKRRCSVCRQAGHNKRTCRSRSAIKTAAGARSAIKIARGLVGR